MSEYQIFRSPEHEAAFHQAGLPHKRGAPTASVCGARLRTGALCPNPPIREGKGRCLSHAGPKAANAFRERQRRGFESGRISAAEWNRAEARRAANRLGDQWKKKPWKPGSTIDLGAHESAFLDALGGVEVSALPAAVADWLRWRYRRTQIDRQDSSAWYKALTQDMQGRVDRAGPRPAEGAGRKAKPGTAPRTWVVDADADRAGGSRRYLPNAPRAPKVVRGKGYACPGRPRTQPASEDEYDGLMRVYRENAAVLEPIMDGVRDEAKQLAVLRTLRDYLACPADVEACKRWLELIGAVQVR